VDAKLTKSCDEDWSFGSTTIGCLCANKMSKWPLVCWDLDIPKGGHVGGWSHALGRSLASGAFRRKAGEEKQRVLPDQAKRPKSKFKWTVMNPSTTECNLYINLINKAIPVCWENVKHKMAVVALKENHSRVVQFQKRIKGDCKCYKTTSRASTSPNMPWYSDSVKKAYTKPRYSAVNWL
jgi:hypothetical protein